MITGYKRPLAATTLRPARDNCEGCHWPEVAHTTPTRSARRSTSETDAANTETRTRLVVHTGSGEARDKATRIHWHIAQNVEFVSDDAQKRTIPWVRITGKDGKERSPTSTPRARSAAPRWTRNPSSGWNAATATTRPATRSSTLPTASTTRSRRARSSRSLPSIKARPRSRSSRRRPSHRGPIKTGSKVRQILADGGPKDEMKPGSARPRRISSQPTMHEILKLSEFSSDLKGSL